MSNKKICVFIGVIIIFFIGRYGIFFSHATLSQCSSCFLYPILRVQQCIVEPLKKWWEQSVAVDELQQCSMLAHQECALLRAENIALHSIVHYQQETQELIRFKMRYNMCNGVVAQVLARHFSEQSHFFLVNAGSRQGIKKDMVAVYNNCLVGKVIEVYPWYCKVGLVTDSECKIAAFCAKTTTNGILEGLNKDDVMMLRYVSHLSQVMEGDVIVSSGQGLIFPAGFGLGTITHAAKENLFYTIQVKPMIDLQSMQHCIIIAKEQIESGGI